jgi:hypothetical protein
MSTAFTNTWTGGSTLFLSTTIFWTLDNLDWTLNASMELRWREL